MPALDRFNSRRDTLRFGKRTVYKAPCELVPKPQTPSPSAPAAPSKEPVTI
jgi:hypothetical protein